MNPVDLLELTSKLHFSSVIECISKQDIQQEKKSYESLINLL